MELDDTKRFILYQENDDDTITFTTRYSNDQPDLTMVIQMTFNALIDMILASATPEAAEMLEAISIIIPNEIPPELED